MTSINPLLLLFVAVVIAFSSCDYAEDPGPLQHAEREFPAIDFDRIEMGDAFNIVITQGERFTVKVKGDRRNVDDLYVRKEGSRLVVGYEQTRNRRHDTLIEITMPSILAATFSGASRSRVSGFRDLENFTLYLAGASECQLDITASDFDLALTGASILNIRGKGRRLEAEVSGASVLKAFGCPVDEASLNVSGASDGLVTVNRQLAVVASGASLVTYRGNPEVSIEVSGSSTVHQELPEEVSSDRRP